MKKCCRCKQEKDFSHFTFLKRSKDGYEHTCRECRKKIDVKYRERRKIYYKNNPTPIEKTNAYYVKLKTQNPSKNLWKLAKRRSVERGIFFDLKIEDICVPTHCPILGIPLTIRPVGLKKYQAYDGSPSIDRIDNSKGYTKENIHVISYKANVIKNYGTLEDHQKIVAYLKKLKRKITH